jgi:hypothetical protein
LTTASIIAAVLLGVVAVFQIANLASRSKPEHWAPVSAMMQSAVASWPAASERQLPGTPKAEQT